MAAVECNVSCDDETNNNSSVQGVYKKCSMYIGTLLGCIIMERRRANWPAAL